MVEVEREASFGVDVSVGVGRGLTFGWKLLGFPLSNKILAKSRAKEDSEDTSRLAQAGFNTRPHLRDRSFGGVASTRYGARPWYP